ncbi:hypothetical protein [Syntrophomonas wolfei]|jgi:hypothetical protein|uniref:hypothetical protein n=1 Tax=Syntrophomonas wolfei TaxID=863 RepID=UPI0023F24D9E|nr:hypothetical protein [Syntrophomonas wolfei]
MTNNIDALIDKIRKEREDVRVNDPECDVAVEEIDAIMRELRDNYEGGEELAKRLDNATGAYGAVIGTRDYTQGVRDCLQVIFGLLGTME